MRKIALVAAREFVATVGNRGFVIGLLLMPIVAGVLLTVMPRLMNARASAVAGVVAVVDQSGEVAADIRTALDPSAIASRRARATEQALASVPDAVRGLAENAPPEALQQALGGVPEFQIEDHAPDADLDREKAWLVEPAGGARRLAIVVVHADAVTPGDGNTAYGGYDLYVPENLDDRVEGALYDGVREALVGARARARGLDRVAVDAVMRVQRARSVTVSASGQEQRTNQTFNRTLPFVFAGLLIFGIMIGGQTLLTSTIEEKSSRIAEVLLSAVSPFELMAGKIVGLMAVSLLVLSIYVGVGVLALVSFAMIGLLDLSLLFYLLIFFLISYLVFASVFGAVGAAVNEMREAQSLMTPIMLVLMAPWLLGPVIVRDPDSPLAVATSFIPPMNTFAMMTRLTSSSPPPAWQVWTTIVIGIASALVALWFAAKIFKVGLLMHGKPPSFRTLLRWARQA